MGLFKWILKSILKKKYNEIIYFLNKFLLRKVMYLKVTFMILKNSNNCKVRKVIRYKSQKNIFSFISFINNNLQLFYMEFLLLNKNLLKN